MDEEHLIAVKVIACKKFKDKWKIKCIKETNSNQNIGKSFKDRIYKETEVISTIPLTVGTHIIKQSFDIAIDDDDKENPKILYSLFKEEVEDSEHLDYLFCGEEFYREVPKEDFWHKHYLDQNENSSLSFRRGSLELDYLKARADLNNFNVHHPKDRKKVQEHLKSIGLEVKKEGQNFMFFSNKDTGISAYFSNFKGEKEEYGNFPSINLKFSGHFFIRKNADLAVRKIMLFFTKSFGSIFTISRVDIRQDIYGVSNPRDYFPDFLNTKKHHWSLRTDPSISLHHNGFLAKETGFTVKNSRYQIVSYNRNLSLEKKYKEGSISKEYYDYYKNLYGDEDVQRLELRLTQKDSCKAFFIMFMHESYNKERTLKYTMANFAKTHVLRDVGHQTRTSRYKVNSIFSELFYLDEKENFKTFRSFIEKKHDLKFNEAIFNIPEDRSSRMMRSFGKSFCIINSKEVVSETLAKLQNIPSLLKLKDSIIEHKDVVNDRMERYKKSLKYLAFDNDEGIEVSLALNRGENISFSYG